MHLTPSSYLELLKVFETVLEKQTSTNLKELRGYQSGIEKLIGAAKAVE